MNKAVFLNCKSLRKFSSDNPFQTEHQEIIKGVDEGLNFHSHHGYKLIGIENQEVDQNCETESIVTQYRLTLALLPQLSAIYVCPDQDGLKCWRMTLDNFSEITNHSRVKEFTYHEEYKFRMPGAGMLQLASIDFGISLEESWMVGDTEENEQASIIAKLNGFMPAEIWHNRFRPSVYEVKSFTLEQVQFLESLKFSNNNN